VVGFGFLLPALTPGAAPAAGKPHASFPATAKDAGKVNAGEKTHLSFPLKNTGNAPLKIRSVDGDCGCLTPHFPPTVPAGGSAVVEATLEAEPMWSGKINKMMRVRTDDPSQSEIQLKVTATVVPFVGMEPSSPIVIPYERGKSYQKEVLLTPRSGSKISLSSPHATDPMVKARLTPPAASDATHAYHLSLNIGPVKRQGDFSVTVKLETTEHKMPEAWVILTFLASSGPVVSPNPLLVPARSADAAAKEITSFQVFTRRGPMRLLGVDPASPQIRAAIKTVADGHSYLVSVHSAGKLKPGPLHTRLKVRTDDKTTPVIELPLDVVIN
jgi:hypothetical protein